VTHMNEPSIHIYVGSFNRVESCQSYMTSFVPCTYNLFVRTYVRMTYVRMTFSYVHGTNLVMSHLTSRAMYAPCRFEESLESCHSYECASFICVCL